jgi:hypothetical protein
MKEQGWIELQGKLGTRPDVVVILGGAGKNTQARLEMFDVPFLKELRRQNIRVVGAERSDNEFSLVPVYRNIGISTVDNFDQASGLLSLMTLIEGEDGHYGIKQHADSLLPKIRIPFSEGIREVN